MLPLPQSSVFDVLFRFLRADDGVGGVHMSELLSKGSQITAKMC